MGGWMSVICGDLVTHTPNHLHTQWSWGSAVSSIVQLFDFLRIDILCITDNYGHSFDIWLFTLTTSSHYRAIFTTHKRSLGQGNIFAPVCHSVHRGGGIPACITGGIPACLAAGLWGDIPACLAGLQGGLQAHTQGGSWGVWPGGVSPGPHPGGCLQVHTQGSVCVSQHALRQTPWPPLHGWLLLRAIRILLECILVLSWNNANVLSDLNCQLIHDSSMMLHYLYPIRSIDRLPLLLLLYYHNISDKIGHGLYGFFATLCNSRLYRNRKKIKSKPPQSTEILRMWNPAPLSWT